MQTSSTEEVENQPGMSNPQVGPSRELDFSGEPDLSDFAAIYSMYSARVYFLCLRMTGNAHDAEDLSQEAFLRLIQKLDKFRGESAFYTWLRRLAINVVLLKFQKASWRHETSLDALMEADSVLDFASRTEFATHDLELLGAIDRINLERAIDQLPPGFKAVFVLHDIEGYGHAEISGLMGCSIGTSKSQLHKARQKLRDLLGESLRGTTSGDRPGSSSGTRRKQSIPQFPRPTPQDEEAEYSRAA
jgi:RNA polymerase sigma-70 factor, ECF subfamily